MLLEQLLAKSICRLLKIVDSQTQAESIDSILNIRAILFCFCG